MPFTAYIPESEKPTGSFTPYAPGATTAPKFLENPKGDGYPLLNADGTQVTPDTIPKPTILGSMKQALLSPIEKASPLTIGADTVKQAEVDAGIKWNDVFTKPTTRLQKGVDFGRALVSTVNAGFSPVSGLIKTAENTPVISPVAHVVNNIFGAIGAGGGEIASKGLDKLPLSQQTRDTIRPLVSELGALTAQIATGKLGELAKTKVSSLQKDIVTHVQNDVANPKVTSNSVENKIPISTPTTRLSDYSKSQGYEPYVQPEQLPTIQTGKVTSDLPVIQTEAPQSSKVGGYTYEPTKETNQSMPTVPEPIMKPVVKSTEAAKPTISGLLEPKNGISKVGTSIETKTIEKGLTEGFKNTAGYDPITIKDQADRASNLMNRDISLARDMVIGKAPMESGLKGEMLIKAMEDHAQRTGDVSLLQDIANSPLVSETSAHAQAMRILAERNPDSVVAKLQEIKKSREVNFEKTTGKKLGKATSETVRQIKNKIPKVQKQTWSEFVDSIQC